MRRQFLFTVLGQATTLTPLRSYAITTRPPVGGGNYGAGMTAKDVDPQKLNHPYWDGKSLGDMSMDDELFFLEELGMENEWDTDFDLPDADKPYLQQEWGKSPSAGKK
eukprot:PhF_6_TR28950/c0_g1_i1/m.42231